MQVASVAELSTSATLGGGKTIDFGISNDPAFFQILSANLYSNQKLAVVRETLCNLWDAHIDAGITDVFGEVSIDETMLVFRDFGKGIHPDLMGEVYGTYGASTKKNDSKSTGGFGLGCKSPFAYTDSFRVTSHHNGTKTLYNITKSSVESGGKPGITQIMQAPSNETGLEVAIPINSDDVYEFVDYIRYITLHGEMKINLKVAGYYRGATGELRTLGMSFKPGSYDMNHQLWYNDYMGNHKVFIRYGNVIYPALESNATRPAIGTIKRLMRIIDVERIVVQAEPDSLALTPSREALSSGKMTEDGIVDLCLNLTKRIELDIRAALPDQVRKVAEKITDLGTHRLSATSWKLWTTQLPQLAYRFINSDMGADLLKHWTPMLRNAEMQAYRNLYKDHKYLKQIMRAIYEAKESGSDYPYRRLYWQFVGKPILKTFASQKDLEPGAFRSMRWAPYRTLANRNHHLYPREMELRPMFSTFGQKVVFISTRLKDIEESCEAFPEFESRARCVNYYVYRVGTKKDENLPAVAAFTAAGWKVVDLTQKPEWDPWGQNKKVRAVKEKPVKPKVANGLIPLRNICEKTKRSWSFVRSLVKDKSTWVGYTDTPLFYVDYADIKTTHLGRFCHHSMITTEMLAHAVVVRNKVEKNMAIKRGAVSVDEYFIKPMLKTFLGKEMKVYLTKHRYVALKRQHDIDGSTLRLVKALDIKIPGLKKLWNRPDLDLVRETFTKHSIYRLHKEGVLTAEEADAASDVNNYCLQEFAWIKQLKNIRRDTVIKLIDEDDIVELVAANPERKAAFRSLVIIAMKNGKTK